MCRHVQLLAGTAYLYITCGRLSTIFGQCLFSPDLWKMRKKRKPVLDQQHIHEDQHCLKPKFPASAIGLDSYSFPQNKT